MQVFVCSHSRGTVAFGVLLLAFATTGCSHGGRVSGTVTFDGKPVPAGVVTFLGANSKAANGQIQDGHYDVFEIPIGQCKVTVDTSTVAMGAAAGGQSLSPQQLEELKKRDPEAAKRMAENAAKQKEMAGKYVEIPSLYSNERDTTITCDVKSGSQKFDITMTKPAGWKPGQNKGPGGMGPGGMPPGGMPLGGMPPGGMPPGGGAH